jgi:hypothetical protein
LGEEIYFPSFKLCPDFYNLLKTIFCAGKIQKNGYNEFICAGDNFLVGTKDSL